MAEDSIQPTPRSGWLGALADGLAAVKSGANRVDLKAPLRNAPLIGGYLSDLVGPEPLGAGDMLLGTAPEEVNEWSYGNAPLRMPEMSNLPQQSKPGRVQGVLDAALAAPMVAAAGKAAGKGALSLLERAVAPVPRSLAQQGAVRLRGGNMDAASVDAYVEPLLGAEGAPATWADKQLRNYLMKDIGSPSDPLLAVEKEIPGLHLPGDALNPESVAHLYNNARLAGRPVEANVPLPEHWGREPPPVGGRMDGIPTYQKQTKYLDKHHSLSNEPLSPWGAHSDSTIDTSTVEDAIKAAGRAGTPFEDMPTWMQKADPTTPLHDLSYPQELGFDHVVDYLSAAESAARDVAAMGGPDAMRKTLTDPRMRANIRPENLHEWERSLALHDAGLTLTPEQIAKTSVADAVRKTAKWNEVLAASMNGPANPALAKGIKAVHKEYPEDGMKWVQLGAKESKELPDALHVAPVRSGGYTVTDKGHNEVLSTSYPQETTEDAIKFWQERYGARYAKEDLAAGLNAEGEAMGHCVGGYCDDVAERGTQIFSLRDKNGNPHVTVEVAPRYRNADDLLFGTLQDPHDADRKVLTGWYQYKKSAQSGETEFELLNSYLKGIGRPPIDNPIDIHQIKGKQNAAPVEKYKKYVQDFVKSGQWGKVGDLRNTGLQELDMAPKYRAEVEARYPGQRYFTKEEYDKLMTDLAPGAAGWQPARGDAYAQGGSVQPTCCPHKAAFQQKFKGYAQGGIVQPAQHITSMRAKLAAHINR